MEQWQDLEAGRVPTSLTYVVHPAIGRDLETPHGRTALDVSPARRAHVGHSVRPFLFDADGVSRFVRPVTRP